MGEKTPSLLNTNIQLDVKNLVSLPPTEENWPVWFQAFIQSQFPLLRNNLTVLAEKLYNEQINLELEKTRQNLQAQIQDTIAKI